MVLISYIKKEESQHSPSLEHGAPAIFLPLLPPSCAFPSPLFCPQGITFAFLSPNLQGPSFCLCNLISELLYLSWLASSYLCNFLDKLLLIFWKKKKASKKEENLKINLKNLHI